MITMTIKGKPLALSNNIVGRIKRDRQNHSTIWVTGDKFENSKINDFPVKLTDQVVSSSIVPIVHSIPSLSHLQDGDIVMVQMSGMVRTLFRIHSMDNSLFTTDRCNSNCLMCSQPPKNIDDVEYHYQINHQVIKLIPAETEILGITGGEPTLMQERFFDMIGHINTILPDTLVHILTNGRAFAWKNFIDRFEVVNTQNIVLGIPLYSDFYLDHDYIVQSRNAFNQTVLGMHRLARLNSRIELRIVLHKLTYKRLEALAKFIFMNIPFIEQVAFMGLEYTGYTPANDQLLWIDPVDYMKELQIAIEYLNSNAIKVSIYNHPLCLLPDSIRKFAVKSISDWKVNYLEECGTCEIKSQCGGVFGTSKKMSLSIRAQQK